MSFKLHCQLLYTAVARRPGKAGKWIGQCISRGERLTYTQLLDMM